MVRGSLTLYCGLGWGLVLEGVGLVSYLGS